MSRNARGGSPAKPGGGSKAGPLVAGILFGMLLGLMVAGGVAWYILNKNPASFENKVPASKAATEMASPATKAPAAASAPAATAPAATAEESKQHFEFYKVLTDKADAGAKHPSAKEEAKPAKSLEVYYLQAGSFPSQDDAEKLKAKLALLGMEPSLQTAAIPNKGTYHRVRVGPFRGADEMNKAVATLKLNGIENPTPIKVQ